MSEIEHDRLSSRQALAAAIVGAVFALVMLAVIRLLIADPPAPKSPPMVLPAEDKP